MRRFHKLPGLIGRALAVCLVAAAGAAFWPLESRAQLPVIRFVRDPDPAPDIKVKDLDGNEVSLLALKGKVVLLNFWATWCGPCRAEIPSLIQLQTRYKDRMQLVGMVVDGEDDPELRSVVKEEAINYPVAITNLDVRTAYGGIAALPTLFVINTEGKVVQKHVGLFNPVLYEYEVRALLDLPVAAKIETFEDTGEIFLKHADRATMLPGVNTESLTPQQRLVVLHKLNAESCECGCKYTLAQCRIYDPACHLSKDRAAEIVKQAAEAGDEKPKPSDSASPSSAPRTPASTTPVTDGPPPAPPEAPKPQK